MSAIYENTGFAEYVPIDRLKALVRSNLLRIDKDADNQWGQHCSYENEKQQVQAYLALYDKNRQCVTVTYRKPQHGYGRMNPRKSLGLSAFSKKTRNAILKDLYYDFDLKNAQPMIMRGVCHSAAIACPTVDDYCTRREEVLKVLAQEIRVCRDDAKDLILMLCFGGSFKSFCENRSLGQLPEPTFVTNFIQETKSIATNLKSLNPEFFRAMEQKCTRDNKNIDTHNAKILVVSQHKQKKIPLKTFFAIFCQEYELRIVQKVMQFLIQETSITQNPTDLNDKMPVLVYEFDGIKVLKENVDKYPGGVQALLLKLNQVTFQRTGFEMTWVEKPIEDFHDLSDILASMALEEPVEDSHGDDVENELLRNIPYQQWKAKHEQEWCKIKNNASFLRKCVDKDGGFVKFLPMSKESLKTAYQHEGRSFRTKKGVLVREIFVNLWLGDKNMRCYDDCDVLPPSLICPPNVLNMWVQSKYDNMPFEENDSTWNQAAIDAYLEHTHIMFKHDEVVINYALNWVAHAIQRPAEKVGTVLWLMGNQGAGKNLWIDYSGKVLGGKQFDTSAPERDVWGNHNVLMVGAYLVVLNEVDAHNCRNASGRIKDITTEETLTINPKGTNQFPIHSFHRFLGASNKSQTTDTSKDDRRNVFASTSNEKVGDRAYFVRIRAALDSPNGLRSLYWYLKNRDISQWERQDIPRTEHHKMLIDTSADPMELFLKQFTLDNLAHQNIELTTTELLLRLNEWNKTSNFEYVNKFSINNLSRKLLDSSLNLPSGSITRVKENGMRSLRFDIGSLKAHFQL